MPLQALFYLAVSATILAFVISLPVALFMNIYLIRYQRLLIGIRFSSMFYGECHQLFMEHLFYIIDVFGIKNSLGAGVVTVAAMITPIMIRAMDEVLKLFPLACRKPLMH